MPHKCRASDVLAVTGDAAEEVLRSAQTMTEQVEMLRREVEAFVRDVRSA